MLNESGTYPDSLEIAPATGPIDTEITLPGSKSITNRALILAALADGTSRLEEALFSEDTEYMSESLNRLGIPVTADRDRKTFEVEGKGGRIPSQSASLFIGNSGTSARFLTALVALGQGRYEVDGVERMRQRPIGPLLSALRELGTDAASEHGNDCPPLVINSSGLEGGQVTMAGDTSSQYFTAMLMIGPLLKRGLRIDVIGELVSQPYIDMTIAAMRDFGASVSNHQYQRFTVEGNQKYTARTYPIEPDASAASYFFALAAVTGGRVRVQNLGKGSMQGDLEFVRILERMGCSVRMTSEWTEVAGPETLSGVETDMNAVSDTMPTLSAIAPFASNPVTIRNVEHVRYKETDRISAVVTELRGLGISVDEYDDGLTIRPGQPKAGSVQTYDDHRMAMSFAILGTMVPGIVIQDPGCVAKTFPEFFEVLASAMR